MKKVYFLLLQLTVFFYLYPQENKTELIFKETEYVTITYKSSFDEYSEFKRIKKGTYLYNNELLKLKHPDYKFIGWEKDGKLIQNGITVNKDIVLYAKWERKLLNVSDVIQIFIVVVALFAIAIPLIIQRKWYRKEQREKKEEEKRLQPRLKLFCDPKDIGLFTPCRRYSNGLPQIKSFKIRVFNEGVTTAKKVQLKIVRFIIEDVKTKETILQKEYNYSFLKLNWSYQDERIRLNLPCDTKMDIQPKSYEDCDFLFVYPDSQYAKLGTMQSDIKFENNMSCFFQVHISGDNIEADECVLSFSINYNTKDIIENYALLKKGNAIKSVDIK